MAIASWLRLYLLLGRTGFTDEGKSAYIHESWRGRPQGGRPLQTQYQRMFEFLNWSSLKVMQAPLSPYRHPSWSTMDKQMRDATIDFCLKEIWIPYFKQYRPKKIICVGKDPAEAILKVLPKTMIKKSVETGWGNVACKYAYHYGFDNGAMMVRVPHLSRFGILTARQCESHLDKIFEPLLKSS